LTKKVSLPGFVVGGPISFANMAIIVKKSTTSSKPKKDILVNYAELSDGNSDKMTDTQAKE